MWGTLRLRSGGVGARGWRSEQEKGPALMVEREAARVYVACFEDTAHGLQ